MFSQPQPAPSGSSAGTPPRTLSPAAPLVTAPGSPGKSTGSRLSARQVESIRTAMRVFMDDALANGVPGTARRYCDACERARPAPGFIHYDRYELCNACAIEYEVARASGLITTTGQYVRDKRFGDGDLYALT
jgi:hypothetical protein